MHKCRGANPNPGGVISVGFQNLFLVKPVPYLFLDPPHLTGEGVGLRLGLDMYDLRERRSLGIEPRSV